MNERFYIAAKKTYLVCGFIRRRGMNGAGWCTATRCTGLRGISGDVAW
ncbi:MAG: hypothetical protein IH594_04110 [Bacteroidales bacterium]|nr:hypothetical protein [Bacteroidales bacterium]